MGAAPRQVTPRRRPAPPAGSDGHGVLRPERHARGRSRLTRTRPPETRTSDEDLTTALPKLLRVFSAVIAPTTLLTALLLYFGRMHATGLFRYLDVQYTVLDLTAQDYLVRSADGMIPPLVVVAGATVLALWAHQVLVRTVPPDVRGRLLRVLAPLCAVAGVLLVGLAIADTVRNGAVFPSFPEARGLGLSLGALLLAYAARLTRSVLATSSRGRASQSPGAVATMTEWAAVFVLVSVGLFWAVGSYAVGVGETRGRQLGAAPPDLYAVTLYSEKSLSLTAPGVTGTPCQDPDAAYRFRYDGLRMVLQSGGQYLLLPSGWTEDDGAALLVPRDSGVRLEFGGGPGVPATC